MVICKILALPCLFIMLLLSSQDISLSPMTCMGDYNGDGVINWKELAPFSGICYSVSVSTYTSCAVFDFNSDGVVNVRDIGPFSSIYGANCSDCSNRVKNFHETDIDCGGIICPDCQNGKSCKFHSDCVSDTCVAGKCIQRLNETNCFELIPGHNNLLGNRINLIFVPLNYGSLGVSTLQGDANGLLDYDSSRTWKGFLEYYPFSENKDKFNFWYSYKIELLSCSIEFLGKNFSRIILFQ